MTRISLIFVRHRIRLGNKIRGANNELPSKMTISNSQYNDNHRPLHPSRPQPQPNESPITDPVHQTRSILLHTTFHMLCFDLRHSASGTVKPRLKKQSNIHLHNIIQIARERRKENSNKKNITKVCVVCCVFSYSYCRRNYILGFCLVPVLIKYLINIIN